MKSVVHVLREAPDVGSIAHAAPSACGTEAAIDPPRFEPIAAEYASSRPQIWLMRCRSGEVAWQCASPAVADSS